MHDPSTPNLRPAPTLEGVEVRGWRPASERRLEELKRSVGIGVHAVSCDVTVGLTLTARSHGFISTGNGLLQFEGEEFSFALPRTYLLSSKEAGSTDNPYLLLTLYHPSEAVHLRLKSVPVRNIGPLVSDLEAFLKSATDGMQRGTYPPIYPPPAGEMAKWGERLKVASIVGLISTAAMDPFNTALYLPIFGGVLAGQLMWMSSWYADPGSNKTRQLPIPMPADLERESLNVRTKIIANLLSKNEVILPEMPQIPAQRSDPAIIPPSQQSLERFPINFFYMEEQPPKIATDAWMLARSRGPKAWSAFCKVISASGYTTTVEDIGAVFLEEGTLTFRGLNTSFRIGGQFVEDTQSYPSDASCSCWIPLMHPGHRVWVGFQEIRRVDEGESLYAAVQEFKRENRASPYLSVYPCTQVSRRSLAQAKVLLVLSLCFLFISGALLYEAYYQAGILTAALSLIFDFWPRRIRSAKQSSWRAVKPAVRAPTLRKNSFDRD